jgi:AcrR family transcriptional regulator
MIARELGVSKSTLFHHIGSKQDMLFEILREPMEEVYPRLQEIYRRPISATEKLRLAVSNHILGMAQNLEVVTVLLLERDCLDEPYREVLRPTRERYVQIFRDLIRDGVAGGEFRPVDPKIAAFAILGMCNWLVQWYNPQGEIPPEEIAKTYAEFAVRALQSDARRD